MMWMRMVQSWESIFFSFVLGFHDARVQFWEPAKFVAKLRAHKTDNNYLFLKTYFDGGHFARDRSLMWAFLLATIIHSSSKNERIDNINTR
jgi:protease II